MTLFELIAKLEKIRSEVTSDKDVTIVMTASNSHGEYEMEEPLYEVVVGKDGVHLISKDV
jgi:glycine cleavage system regulatory protein